MGKIKTFGMDFNGELGKEAVKVICFDADAGAVGMAKTAKTLAYIMKTLGIENETKTAFTGLYRDELVAVFDEMLDEALEIYNWEVNGVAG
jgi:hypothetical protein